MRVISLGWGVQSFGLAAMSALGVLPKVDVAIHADTTHERTATYGFAAKWTPWLEERGVRVVTVKPDDRKAFLHMNPSGNQSLMIPAYTAGPGQGVLERQCTRDWKIAPIRRWLQANRNGAHVEMWLGITTDEVTRAKPSNVQYVTNVWPFIFERPMSRQQVEVWLQSEGLEVPPRSACYFCPYQSRKSWRAMGDSDFIRAVAVDEEIRHKRPPFDLFLHSSRIPLVQVDLRSPQEKGQMELDLWDNECSGVCGI